MQIDRASVSHVGGIHGLFSSTSRYHELQLCSSNNSIVLHTDSGRYAGLLCSETTKALGCVSAAGAQVQAYVDLEDLKKHFKRRDATEFEIMINVYGPRDAATRVGDALMDRHVFLQAPVYGAWDQSYTYCNPQSSSLLGDVMDIDSEIPIGIGPGNLRRRLTMSKLDTQDHLHKILPAASLEPVTEDLMVSSHLRTPLMDHQKSALQFMGKIERSITQGQTSAGGILADQPGLGKSLTSLALIASTLTSQVNTTAERFSCSTLLIVPSSMVTVWQLQIEEHFYPGQIQFLTYIGPTRKTVLADSKQHDIVLTSYETLVSDHSSLKSEVFSSAWHRIVVDEAHYIKNRSTKRFQALNAIEARFRWCLTGTPIHNGIEDMSALLIFLRIAPFHVHGQYQRQITAPLKCGDVTGLKRLHKVMSKIMVRRTKDMLDLPDRQDLLVEVELSQEEQNIYEVARDASNTLIDKSLSQGSASPDLNILQSILRQRQICCHGLDLLPAPTRAVFNRSARINAALTNTNSKQEFPIFCEACSVELSLGDRRSSPSNCIHVICNKCLQVQSEDTDVRCPFRSEDDISLSKRGQDPQSLQTWASELQYRGPSSKVSSLLENLCSIREQNDSSGCILKSVVFSSWTRLLHLTSLALTDAGINFVRYDGTFSRDEKQRVLTDFQSNPRFTVLLISIGSGGVGYVEPHIKQSTMILINCRLNLSTASYIHLLEPQWNPMVESQALDRVHRIGQRNPVTTYRYIAKDTFEEVRTPYSILGSCLCLSTQILNLRSRFASSSPKSSNSPSLLSTAKRD